MAKQKQSERQKFIKHTTQVQEDFDLQALRDIADDVIESDFVPYACLYDGTTILTKDGELLQTIKITGTGFDTGQANHLRQAIRQAIKQSIPNESYAIWLHTLRRQQVHTNQSPSFADAFSTQLDQFWRNQLPHSASFVNELYITVVRTGEPTPLKNIKKMLHNFSTSRNRDARTAEIDRMSDELTTTTRSMLAKLNAYGAKLLSVVEREGEFVSEQLEFLEKLINLQERPMPLPRQDLSFALTSGEITFGYNAMEVRSATGTRRFAAILTLKEYKESTLAGIDKFLEIPCEIIISQCFSFTGAEVAQESYAKQARYLSISGDAELAKWMEIDRLMETRNSENAQEFGTQQTSIFLIAPSVRQLETNMRLVQRSLGRLGMVAVREDLRMEECYWAQLPANFPFVVRKQSIDTEHLAGFANLQSAPMGNKAGSSWGAPVSVFTTLQDLPYFFNFHRENTAHTVILGKPKSGRTSFLHFLLTQTRKLPVALWYLDASGRGRALIESMGGHYVQPGTSQLALNPFHLADTPSNRDFLALWLATLTDPHAFNVNSTTHGFFKTLVEKVMQQPRAERRLSTMLPFVQEADPSLAHTLQAFCSGGPYGALFDMPEDNFTTDALIGWDISPWMADPATRIPLVSYLLHRLTGSLTGAPTLIIMEEGFTLLDTPLFASRAGGWCDYLTSQNAACILTTEAIDESGSRAFVGQILPKIATIFAMADTQAGAEYAMGFGFSEQEISTLAHLGAHHPSTVLQKRGPETAAVKMDLTKASDATRAVLSGHGAPKAPVISPADQLAALMGFGSQPA